MKSVYYIATVVRCYRMLIDEYLKTGRLENIDFYIQEIQKRNKTSCDWFLHNKVGPNEQLYNVRNDVPTKEFLGIVLHTMMKTQIATLEQRNYFEINEISWIFGPKLKIQTL